MLLPYRVKNPVRQFPVVTVILIAINLIVYAFTTEILLVIREDVVERYAFAFGSSPIINVITAMFLHGDIFHLLGNMLFLWVFGPPVEDRLGKPTYIILYFTTGFAGDLLQAGLDLAVAGGAQTGIGASGCIMGVIGAYWYLFSWSKVCVFYWISWFWHGVREIAAIWIIGLYFLMDLAEGALYGAAGVSGGVANFAHIGGSVAGALMCMAMRVNRDSEEISEAKAIQAETKDLSMLPLHAIQSMVEAEPGNPELIRGLIVPALNLGQQAAIDRAMAQAGPALIDKDPSLVAHYLLDLRGQHTIYQPIHLLHLAGQMARGVDTAKAVKIHNLIVNAHSTQPETETALYRMAQCYWGLYKDGNSARKCIAEMEKRFPGGPMSQFGRTLLKQMGPQQPVN